MGEVPNPWSLLIIFCFFSFYVGSMAWGLLPCRTIDFSLTIGLDLFRPVYFSRVVRSLFDVG